MKKVGITTITFQLDHNSNTLDHARYVRFVAESRYGNGAALQFIEFP